MITEQEMMRKKIGFYDLTACVSSYQSLSTNHIATSTRGSASRGRLAVFGLRPSVSQLLLALASSGCLLAHVQM